MLITNYFDGAVLDSPVPIPLGAPCHRIAVNRYRKYFYIFYHFLRTLIQENTDLRTDTFAGTLRLEPYSQEGKRKLWTLGQIPRWYAPTRQRLNLGILLRGSRPDTFAGMLRLCPILCAELGTC
jgi:hypothetical protein